MNPIDVTFDLSRHYVRDVADVLGTEISNKILGWIRQRNLPKLTSCCEGLGLTVVSPDLLRVLMQIEAFFKKNVHFSVAEQCEEAARLSFYKAEMLCRITNRRLDHYYIHRDRLDPDVEKWMTKAEMFIDRVLGSFEPFLDELPKLVRFTSGATLSRPRSKSLPFHKVSKKPECTPRAYPYLQSLSYFFGYGKLRGKPVLQNRVEVVRKNWKTDRTIACEPEGNIPLQLAFDTFAKRRLRMKTQIDLADQSRNQSEAKRGSIDGQVATVDLSMASDTISYNVVAWLFPTAWFNYLDDVRSPVASGKFGTFPYAKFSSMGNGSTFAIETLIFASACHAVGSQTYQVYGDDITIETEKVEDLKRFMRFLGFVVNPDKSFAAGPFRESCGGNYLNGIDVTPFYLRDVGKRKAILCHNVNGLMSVSKPGGYLWDYLRLMVESEKLPLVPFNDDSLSGVWIDVPTSWTKRVIRRGPNWRWRYKAYKPHVPQFLNFDLRNLFLWYLDRYRIGPFQGRRIPGQCPTLSFNANGKVKDLGDVHLIRSTYPAFSHKYRRKWVHWVPPVAVAPVHLHWWTEFVIRNI